MCGEGGTCWWNDETGACSLIECEDATKPCPHEPVAPSTRQAMTAHAAWGRRFYPEGHPFHPDTGKD